MVRILAGTLMEAGRGACEPAYMADILAAKDRKDGGTYGAGMRALPGGV